MKFGMEVNTTHLFEISGSKSGSGYPGFHRMRQRGNKNLSFPPAFRDLSEKLLVKYSQLYKHECHSRLKNPVYRPFQELGQG